MWKDHLEALAGLASSKGKACPLHLIPGGSYPSGVGPSGTSLHSFTQRIEIIIYVPGERCFLAQFIGNYFLLEILKIKNTSIIPRNNFRSS